MNTPPQSLPPRRRPQRRRRTLGALVFAALALTAIAFTTSSQAAPSYDPNKIVSNAAGMSADTASGSSDCTTEAFLAQDNDLWHFVVPDEKVTTGTGSDRVTYTLTANITAVIIEWDGGELNRYEGTDDYDQGNAGPNLFWAYTEPGRTISRAWLEYSVTRDDGETPTETFLMMPHNLSHACAAETAPPVPPTIDIDSTGSYDILYDLEYTWTLDKIVDADGLRATGNDPFSLDYSVVATRNEPPVEGNWRIVDGSMKVTGTIDLTDAAMADVVVTTPNADCAVKEDAVPGDDSYVYECTFINEPMITAASGLNGTTVTVEGTVTTPYGTGTDSVVITWGLPATSTVVDTFHATARIVDGDYVSGPSTGPLTLEYSVQWLPTTCPDQRVNVAELFDGVTGEPLGVDDTLTIVGCPAVPGKTIGYWGNRTGAPLVVAAIPALKTLYPALAAIPITNEASVRNYFTRASCSGDCVTMFLAQALATAMNARDTTFGSAPVALGDECRTVNEWLAYALRTSIPTDRTERIALKSLFDDLNNGRATRCAEVS